MMREVAERASAALELLDAARALESTRTDAALVSAAVAGIAQLGRRGRPRRSVVVSVRLAHAGSNATLLRTGPLTPYDIETLIEDVRGIAAGARVDVTLSGGIRADEVTQVRRRLGVLHRRDIAVSVRAQAFGG